ncbi:oxysterol binding protein, putative [Coccidioides posadasii C735 delta SOWgp]|uniref:Oxysterol-binding protein n=3 Tax=Coccidioides posadasii TaxID=199306 RepID=E9D915_COCPS|nr:oxysterol binding protein, putative [Coccidioides posadasii C735 delta SOWgp]EER29607.1 oxysterol binding protein, putative [Coccidioides posadasii C735 delta SOWgp]EFW17049.1 oxysterol-binding protein [Coccidioides posadasii str. Silveira]KMM69963.1 oxysterol-binding protein [Coccidioides posadasii RMSCC 3488]|eukprot:XP_003071752.1 oxysterol binding protein, putative [Coccidioides posadasii C735 delta SOWgp]
MLPKLPLGHGHHTPRRSSLNSNKSSTADESSQPTSPGVEDETVVEPDQGNVLSHIISQLRPGADLSRVVLPTFILEPRSMLERITNFMAHPETLLDMPKIDDPLQRFVSVVRFYLSGWHIKPPGVKKPLNPILGEIYTCYWEYPDKSHGYYISEQTSHHPPKSSYFFMVPEHHIRIDGTLKPRSRFLGNSAASMMEGIAILQFLNRGTEKHGERYIVTQPNMYARGILFGKMKYELGDHSYVRCPENNLVADVEFKTKGYFSGTYNAIGGSIKNEATGEIYYELSGFWNGEMYIKDVATGKRELLFNATNAKHSPPLTRPLEEQEPRESQRLWHSTTQALLARNHEVATEEKTKIEDRQREEAAQRADKGVEWRPRLFRRVKGGPGGPEEGEEDLDWILNAIIDPQDPKLATRQILAVAPILKGQVVNHQFDIPAHCPSSHHSSTPNSVTKEQSNNLIDLGNDGAADQRETTKNNGSGELVDLLSGSGNEGQKQISLTMSPLQPTISDQGHPTRRRDSESSGVDEFVDAQD